jgi:hypothetical protein
MFRRPARDRRQILLPVVDLREKGSEVRCSMSGDSCHREIDSATPAARPLVDPIDS